MRLNQKMFQQQKQVQKLAMTQQLQQAIQILQYNTEDLQTFIESKALENPLLEVKTMTEEQEYWQPTINNTNVEKTNYLNQIPDDHHSLFEYLIDQIHLNYRETYLRTLILFLVEYIDLNGYLSISLEKASQLTGAEPIQMLDALTLLQQLDPAGVGARDLRECLMLQVERDNHAPALTYIVLEEEFDALANRKWAPIAKKFDSTLAEVQEIFDYIQTLSPAPGKIFDSLTELYIRPDLTVAIENQEVILKSNKTSVPQIRFQENYFKKMQAVPDEEVQLYIQEKKQEFEWLQKTVHQRGETILRVGLEIIQRQQAFFLEATRPLEPMTLKEIAASLDMHESTISRAVNGKYMETPFGVFELKIFFTQGLANAATGETTSTDSVKKVLQQLVDTENKAKPLSDQKLVDLLQEQGVSISRRTVTKYREALNIPASSKRKRYDA